MFCSRCHQFKAQGGNAREGRTETGQDGKYKWVHLMTCILSHDELNRNLELYPLFGNAASSSSKPQFQWLREVGGTCLHGAHKEPPISSKVALFDLDQTLIKPKGGRKHPRDASDWEWWHNKVKRSLNQAAQDGYVSSLSTCLVLSTRRCSATLTHIVVVDSPWS